MKEKSAHKILENTVLKERSALFFIFLVPICAVSFHQYVTAVLAISFFLWLFIRKKANKPFDVKGRIWFWFVLSFIVISVLALAVSGFNREGVSELDKYSRLLLCWPLMYVLATFRWSSKFFWLSIAVAGIYAGLSSVIDVFIRGGGRADSFGMLNPIFFGGFSLLFGYLSFLGSVIFIKNKQGLLCAVCLLGVLGGAIAVILSGSRGGLLAFPFLCVLISIYLLLFKYVKVCLSFLLLTFTAVVLVVTQPNSMKNRIAAVDNEISGYIYDGVINTSVGLRLFMWETAWHGFLEKPVLGHGPGNFKGLPYKSSLRLDYKEQTNLHGHAHSEYFHNMSTRGILGLITLLSVFMVPMFFAVLFLIQRKYEYGFALVGVVGSFMMFALTDMVLMKGNGSDLFNFLVCVLLVMGGRNKDAVFLK